MKRCEECDITYENVDYSFCQKCGKKLIDGRSYIVMYKDTVSKIEYDETNELLETVIEIEELDKIYHALAKFNRISTISHDEFNKYKSQLLQKRIQRKFYKYMFEEEKTELLKSLIDEILYCKKRYPQYEKAFNVELLKIENVLN